jgi:hypothetical protein
MSENTDDIKFGLLFFKNDYEKDEFILKINEVIKEQKYKNKFLYEGNLIENVENIFIKNTFASWGKKTISKISDYKQLLETKKYRIIFKCIQTNIYYFEKNGAINCIDENNKQSETIYNSLVFHNNPNKYILLDRKLIEGCEIADLYDKENRLLFHNKKCGDLRVLSLQIIIGALIMKNKNKNQQFINYLINKGIHETIANNFIYVIGIIGNNIKIAQKDKISLGIVNYILRQHNIELYIDFINEI